MADSGSDGELTYFQEKYGGFGGSSSGYGGGGYGSGYGSAYGSGPPPSVLDGSIFLPAYTETDRGEHMRRDRATTNFSQKCQKSQISAYLDVEIEQVLSSELSRRRKSQKESAHLLRSLNNGTLRQQ